MEGGDHDHEMKDSGRLWRRNKEAVAVEKPPAAFLVKTHMVVENPSTNEVISWNGDGTGFVVWHPPEFARDILPTLFKHSNFSSFVRQLNTYGFRKVATSRWEFCNDFFRKGERQLLRKIHRRKAWTMAAPLLSQSAAEAKIQHSKCSNKDQRSSATQPSSGNCSESLVNENKRLKKENGVLSSELTSMKRKLKELVDLVATYAMNSSLEKKDENEDEDEDELGLGPKLFGVRLEVRTGEKAQRKRREEPGERSLISVILSQSCK